MDSAALDQLTMSSVVVMLIQWVKGTKLFPFVNENTASLNRVIGWLAAGGAAIGLHLAFDSTSGTLTITGLTLTTMLHAGWDWIKSVAVQELIYQGVLQKPKTA